MSIIDKGWHIAVSNDTISGTTRSERQMDKAIQIKLKQVSCRGLIRYSYTATHPQNKGGQVGFRWCYSRNYRTNIRPNEAIQN